MIVRENRLDLFVTRLIRCTPGSVEGTSRRDDCFDETALSGRERPSGPGDGNSVNIIGVNEIRRRDAHVELSKRGVLNADLNAVTALTTLS